MLTSVLQCGIGLGYGINRAMRIPRPCAPPVAGWSIPGAWGLGFTGDADPVPGVPGEGVFRAGVNGFRTPTR